MIDSSTMIAYVTGGTTLTSALLSGYSLRCVARTRHPTSRVTEPESTVSCPLPTAVDSGSPSADADDQSWYDIVGVPIMDWLSARVVNSPFDLRMDPEKLADLLDKAASGWFAKQRSVMAQIKAPVIVQPEPPVVVEKPAIRCSCHRERIEDPRWVEYCRWAELHPLQAGVLARECDGDTERVLERYMGMTWQDLAELEPERPVMPTSFADRVRILTKIEMLLNHRIQRARASKDPKMLSDVADERRMLAWCKVNTDLVVEFYTRSHGDMDVMRTAYLVAEQYGSGKRTFDETKMTLDHLLRWVDKEPYPDVKSLSEGMVKHPG